MLKILLQEQKFMQKLKMLIKKYEETLLYMVFGAMTSLVNWVVYFPLYNLTSIPATVSTAIAWIISVAFSFLTNKPIVFKSHDWSAKVVVPELLTFTGCRIGSGLLEAGSILMLVDILGWDGNIIKILVSVVVVLVNYVGTKLSFRKKA